MDKKERFLALVSNKKTDTLEKNRQRIEQRPMLRRSQHIALMILERMDKLEMTPEEVALKAGISVEELRRITSGKIEILDREMALLGQVLDIE